MTTLYRAYRPQNFKEIVNQNHIKVTLQHELESGRLAHAYLFCGPRGIGKTTIARIFAKSLNCTERKEGEHEPCNECQVCKDSTAARNMDIIEIDAASHTGVDNVRENIISVARIAPGSSKYKVFIIDEVHMLSISAFNALLKVLEEPPKNTMFIICTTEVHKIPDTIISRTERFDFKRIGVSDIVKKLQYIISKEKIKVDDKILERIAHHSDGHMRDAESLLGQVVAIGGDEISAEEADLVIPRSDIGEVINLIAHLSKKDAGSAVDLLNKLLEEGVSLKRFLLETVELLRKIMLAKVNSNLSNRIGLELGDSLELKISELSKDLDLPYVIRMLERLMQVKSEMKGAFIEQLPFEIALVELCVTITNSTSTTLKKTAPVARPMDVRQQNSAPANIPPPIRQEIQAVKQDTLAVPIVEPIVSKVVPQVSGKDVSLEEITLKWKEVLTKIKSHNHSLTFILKASEPKDIKGRVLTIAFKYKFHKERICDPTIKESLEQVLLNVYGTSIVIDPVIDENMSVESTQSSNTIQVNEAPATISEKTPMPTETPVKNISSETEIDNSKNDEDILNNVLKTFGGKVV